MESKSSTSLYAYSCLAAGFLSAASLVVMHPFAAMPFYFHLVPATFVFAILALLKKSGHRIVLVGVLLAMVPVVAYVYLILTFVG